MSLRFARRAAALLLLTGLMASAGGALAGAARTGRPAMPAASAATGPAVAPLPAVSARVPLAVIVNRSNPTDSLGKAELRTLFLGERTTWPHGRRVTLVLREPGQPERAAALRLIYGMSEDDMMRHFIQQTFSGSAAAGPRAMATPEGVKRFVFNVPGAIGVIRLADVDDTVKVLRVNGAAPGDPHYTLVMSES
jgi:ABC-type phosphate transport system substrate-binding protein